ncbi:histone deacetylase [candidate division KSB1 bacterium]
MVEKLDRRGFIMVSLGAVVLLDSQFLSCGGKNDMTAFLYSDIYLRHLTGDGHPEKPERLTSIYNRLNQSEWYGDLTLIRPESANLDVISLVHSHDYIETVRKECEAGYTSLSTGDTVICGESYAVALEAAGGVCSAVDAVFEEKAKNAFCAVRPPGHHATPDRGMGFCVFNNVAIAARYAQRKYNAERVLIADWDVHHGNGTQDTFYTDGSVFFMSTHQSPLYPGTGKIEETGAGDGEGATMNRPFPAGAGNSEIIGAFRDDLLPAARAFRPDFTLISAGFDSRVDDPLGSFEVDDDGFRELTEIMLEIAHVSGGGRLVSVLEGGYNIEGIARAAEAHVDELFKA